MSGEWPAPGCTGRVWRSRRFDVRSSVAPGVLLDDRAPRLVCFSSEVTSVAVRPLQAKHPGSTRPASPGVSCRSSPTHC